MLKKNNFDISNNNNIGKSSDKIDLNIKKNKENDKHKDKNHNNNSSSMDYSIKNSKIAEYNNIELKNSSEKSHKVSSIINLYNESINSKYNLDNDSQGQQNKNIKEKPKVEFKLEEDFNCEEINEKLKNSLYQSVGDKLQNELKTEKIILEKYENEIEKLENKYKFLQMKLKSQNKSEGISTRKELLYINDKLKEIKSERNNQIQIMEKKHKDFIEAEKMEKEKFNSLSNEENQAYRISSSTKNKDNNNKNIENNLLIQSSRIDFANKILGISNQNVKSNKRKIDIDSVFNKELFLSNSNNTNSMDLSKNLSTNKEKDKALKESSEEALMLKEILNREREKIELEKIEREKIEKEKQEKFEMLKREKERIEKEKQEIKKREKERKDK